MKRETEWLGANHSVSQKERTQTHDICVYAISPSLHRRAVG